MRWSKFMCMIVSVILVMFAVGIYEARCDVQVDVKIMPKVLTIGDIRDFNAKIQFPKFYDMRQWTIMSIRCEQASALPESIQKEKRHIMASFSMQDLEYSASGKNVPFTVTVVAKNDSETVTFVGSDTIWLKAHKSPAISCESITSLNLDDPGFHKPFVISSSQVVAADPVTGLPEYCNVTAAVGNDNIEMRLPTKTWNGKFLFVGGYNLCGFLPTQQGTSSWSGNDQLKRGYAIVGTDAGHTVTNNSQVDAYWGYDAAFPDAYEREVDFGYRAVYVSTIAGKLVTKRFYNTRPKYSYFRGCSIGGRQALVSAQRYPEQFDGIIAGDPAHAFTGFSTIMHGYPGWLNWDRTAGELILPASKVPLIANAVNTACDTLDGVADGILNDPRACTWDPFTSTPSILCPDDIDAPDCLTIKQATMVRKMYDAPRDLSGKPIYPGGRPRGDENTWITAFIMPDGSSLGRIPAMAQGGLRYLQFQPDPGPTYSFFDFPCSLDGCELSAVEKLSLYAPIYNGTDTDLSRFRDRNGKMIMYTGWRTANAHPHGQIYYYERVLKDTPGARNFFRFYLVPGMSHCNAVNGVGPIHDDFRWLLPQLEKWVEKDITPEKVVTTATTSSVPTRTRLICPYPEVSKYKGAPFDSDKADSFTCIYPDYPIPDNDWDDVDRFPWDTSYWETP